MMLYRSPFYRARVWGYGALFKMHVGSWCLLHGLSFRTVQAQTDCQLRYLEVKDLGIDEKDLKIIRGTLQAYANCRNKADIKRLRGTTSTRSVSPVRGLNPSRSKRSLAVESIMSESADAEQLPSPTTAPSETPSPMEDSPRQILEISAADMEEMRLRQQRCEDMLTKIIKHLAIRS
jgi:hypothetical protein